MQWKMAGGRIHVILMVGKIRKLIVINIMIAYAKFIAAGGGHLGQHRWSCIAAKREFSRRRRDPSQRRANSKSARGHMTQRESGRPYGQRDESPQEGCDGGAVRPASSASATAFQEPRAPNRRSLSLHAAACPSELLTVHLLLWLRWRVRQRLGLR